MANVMRLLHGDPQIVRMPKLAEDAIEMGDLLWWDEKKGAVRNASAMKLPQDDEQESRRLRRNARAAFAKVFVGVAMSCHEVGDSGEVAVATAGEFVFSASHGRPYPKDSGASAVVMLVNEFQLRDQWAEESPYPEEAIGRIVVAKPHLQKFVVVRIEPKMTRGER